MSQLREYLLTLMSRGVISPGWYSIWTGVAMLFVVYSLRTATDDPAVPYVGLVLAITGVWCLERGYRHIRHGSVTTAARE